MNRPLSTDFTVKSLSDLRVDDTVIYLGVEAKVVAIREKDGEYDIICTDGVWLQGSTNSNTWDNAWAEIGQHPEGRHPTDAEIREAWDEDVAAIEVEWDAVKGFILPMFDAIEREE